MEEYLVKGHLGGYYITSDEPEKIEKSMWVLFN